jgi:DNA-binding IclR family transcriptional regulator
MIMECIAAREDEGATAEAISRHTGIGISSIGGYLKTLIRENIVYIQDDKDGDKNQYCFKEPIFGLYFKLVNELGKHLPTAA